jgi:acetyltransferase-like isoleucine patch superfamily enzyme
VRTTASLRRKGVLLDHGTGCVIGATAVIGDRVSIMQGVTLGGTGKVDGDRHPKVGEGVLIGASATILGNIKVSSHALPRTPVTGTQTQSERYTLVHSALFGLVAL